MLVEIDDRTYADFMEWAAANEMSEEDALKYINRAFRDRFMIDKYGDLNERFAKPEPKMKLIPEPEPEPVPEQQKNVIQYETAADTVKQEPEPCEDSEPAEEKPKPKRKVLKSK